MCSLEERCRQSPATLILEPLVINAGQITPYRPPVLTCSTARSGICTCVLVQVPTSPSGRLTAFGVLAGMVLLKYANRLLQQELLPRESSPSG